MEYDVREYLRQMKEGNAKLKPVITLVMYWKHNKWKYANDNDTELNRESVALINELTNSDLKIEEGKETVKMCKAIEDIREEGRQEGSIIGFIAACREFDKTDDEIMQLITEKYAINNKEAERLMKEV